MGKINEFKTLSFKLKLCNDKTYHSGFKKGMIRKFENLTLAFDKTIKMRIINYCCSLWISLILECCSPQVYEGGTLRLKLWPFLLTKILDDGTDQGTTTRLAQTPPARGGDLIQELATLTFQIQFISTKAKHGCFNCFLLASSSASRLS